MLAIIKRELASYFKTNIGFVVLAIFDLFAGLFFYAVCLNGNTGNLTYVFSDMFIILLFVVPILTMRLFSEEKRQKTDQALLTSPISLSRIVFGKFISAVTVLALCMAVFFMFAVVVSVIAGAQWAVILCNMLGFLLLGSALISIGLFISSLTESQVIAAIGSLAAGLIIYLMQAITTILPISSLANLLNKISFSSHYENFTLGILNFADVVFFVTVTFTFLFFTVRVLERKRWK